MAWNPRALYDSYLASPVNWKLNVWPPRPRNCSYKSWWNSASVSSQVYCLASRIPLSFQMLISWISLVFLGRHCKLIRNRRDSLLFYPRMPFIWKSLLTTYHLCWSVYHSESKIAQSYLVATLSAVLPTSSFRLFLAMLQAWATFPVHSIILSYRWNLR
jgi:hypothetical protein